MGCAVAGLRQTFGDRINLHPHLHFLVTEGGVGEAGVFRKVSRIDDSRLAGLFARDVLASLVHKELLSPEWAERLLSWCHTGFNVHSRVRAKTKRETERVGKYMIRPLLSLQRLSLDERTGQVGYRYGKQAKEVERVDYLEFIEGEAFQGKKRPDHILSHPLGLGLCPGPDPAVDIVIFSCTRLYLQVRS